MLGGHGSDLPWPAGIGHCGHVARGVDVVEPPEQSVVPSEVPRERVRC
jgi:hypothetical protein